jgi:hypothetical protein
VTSPSPFSEIVDRVDGKLDTEVRGVGIRDRDLQHYFSAAVPARVTVLCCLRTAGRAEFTLSPRRAISAHTVGTKGDPILSDI